jgi:Fic family protein
MTNSTLIDRGETPGLLEPLLPAEESPHWTPLAEKVKHLTDASAGLERQLTLLDRETRLAIETKAFACEIRASWEIEGETASGADIAAARSVMDGLRDAPWPSSEYLVKAHSALFPSQRGLRVVDVSVGRHVAPSPGSLPRLLAHLERGYGRPGRIGRMLGVAAGHHRLNWCHPFLDGNGRVARLVACAGLRRTLRGAGAWSLSEGLLARREDYLRLMALADEPRRGDRDGRGHLSEARLASFIGFMLEVAEERIAVASVAVTEG